MSILILVVHYYLRKYNYQDFKNVLGWDVLAYYLYLPFTFIYADPGISNQEIVRYIFETYQPSGTFYQAYPLPNGNWSPMYTIGFAIFYFPFFIIGHIWALLSDYPADGFSYPYQFSISNGVVLYVVAGIFILRKFLKEFFSEKITVLTLLGIVLGTTLFHESIADECGPHAMMFASFVYILYLNKKWHDLPKKKTAFLLGLIIGLAILARGSGIFIALIPLLWNVYDKKSIINKLNIIKTNWKHIIVGCVGLSLFPLIQMIYWKLITGEFIFNTYQVTPGFDWLDPHFMKVFFSYKKGWLLYTPMIAFVFLGFIFLKKKNKEIFWASFTFFAVNVYVISSWGTWWQGGSFGSRYFVESYAVLCLPLGYFIQEILKKKIIKWFFIPLFSFFIFLNLFQTWQFNNFIFDGYSMTKEFYWRVFLKTKVTDEDRKFQEVIRDFKPVDVFKNQEDYNHRTFGFLNFEEINSIPFDHADKDTNYAYSKPYSYKLTTEKIFGPTFKI
ncbi:MAG: hypothetical protein KDD45_09470, partial [Bdellovibrionales bacterium]|nr:hypothetical protein [Bdellovibrionales bacterium]